MIILESLILTNNTTQALIIAPTREIAAQNHSVISALGKYFTHLRIVLIIGGLNVKHDKVNISQGGGAHVVVGTPGRMKELMLANVLKVGGVRVVVLDEVDQLFQSTFRGQTTWLLTQLPERRQTLMFTATLTTAVTDELQQHMNNPQFVLISADDPSLIGVKQYRHRVTTSTNAFEIFQAKLATLLEILAQISFHQCVVFSNNKGKAQELVEALKDNGWESVCIGGDMEQRKTCVLTI